jgi:hypothetical protein
MLRLALVVLVVGCRSTSTPTAPLTVAKVHDTGLPSGPPLVTPGEHISYKLALQGVELASFELAVGDTTDIGGAKAIVVQSHAKAVGLARMVANIDDTFTSWIDVATGRPLRWSTDEFATKGTDKEKTDANFAGRTAATIPIEFHINDQPPSSEPQTVSMPDVWDFNSFLVALRIWSPARGSTVATEVLRSRYMWHVEMTVRGKETLATALGTLPAIRLDGRTYKLDRAGKRVADSDERNFSIWISDDDGRVPLQTIAKTDYGDIKMEITDYSPGTGQRLRP